MLRFNYDKIVDIYDSFEISDDTNKQMTEKVSEVLKEKECSSVWDAACGTGAQAIPLAKAGFKVHASDISPHMLNVARKKAEALRIDFFQGDMTLNYEILQPDAVITLYNALGHLNKDQFHQAVKNFSKTLPEGGLFIGDVDNRAYLEKSGQIPKGFFLSGQNEESGWTRLSKADPIGFGLYRMQDKWFEHDSAKISEKWDLQTWYKDELEDELDSCGFTVLEWHDRDFHDRPESEKDSILFVAQKQ
ncbi:MAG: class I SAM-dependent methyltransferase [Lentisphaeraceae bacterium]|nr:class I SAM-dependent methyltransferase [Lentisphaeraceae bacterium]